MIKHICLTIISSLIIGCAQKQSGPENGEATHSPAGQVSPVETKTVEGIVESVQMGKDGYTAKLDSSGEVYYVTISRSNLEEPEQYMSVKMGDTLRISGDLWLIEDRPQITVRQILQH